MITGIGTDIISISRIEDAFKKFGDKFAERILSDEELEIFIKRKNEKNNQQINYLAKRFAGKEAISKAIGTGIGGDISFKDISILNDEKGKPFVKISAGCNLAKFLQNKKIFISLSDDVLNKNKVSLGLVSAFVILEHL
ncbi:MAG: holo-ACP synthase [Rickettsiales bacterium]|nr:holo-ACP synthase [Rickettsiales bacterium]